MIYSLLAVIDIALFVAIISIVFLYAPYSKKDAARKYGQSYRVVLSKNIGLIRFNFIAVLLLWILGAFAFTAILFFGLDAKGIDFDQIRATKSLLVGAAIVQIPTIILIGVCKFRWGRLYAALEKLYPELGSSD